MISERWTAKEERREVERVQEKSRKNVLPSTLCAKWRRRLIEPQRLVFPQGFPR